MKQRASTKKLSLPMTIIIASTTMIALLIFFCATSAYLILNGTLKNTDLNVVTKIMVALAAFIGTIIVLKNNEKYSVAAIFTVFVTVLMLCSSIILRISMGDFIIALLFVLIGIGAGLIFRSVNHKKARFLKKRYR